MVEGLVPDDPGKRLDIRTGMFGTLKMHRVPDKLVCITEITPRGKVKAEVFDEEAGDWGEAKYIDPDKLVETWESEEPEDE